MTKLAERNDIPLLEGGWINLTEAARLLGYTRAYVYKKAAKPAEDGGFETLRRVGTQPTFVVNMSEIESLLEKRDGLKPRPKKQKPEPAPEETPEEKELSLDELLSQV